MNHLFSLKSYLEKGLEHKVTPDKLHLLVVNGNLKAGQLNYVTRLLLIDYRHDPLEVMALVQNWLEKSGRPTDIVFSSEVIDKETFDLEIDINMQDKYVRDGLTAHLCPPVIWDDTLQAFVPVDVIGNG